MWWRGIWRPVIVFHDVMTWHLSSTNSFPWCRCTSPRVHRVDATVSIVSIVSTNFLSSLKSFINSWAELLVIQNFYGWYNWYNWYSWIFDWQYPTNMQFTHWYSNDTVDTVKVCTEYSNSRYCTYFTPNIDCTVQNCCTESHSTNHSMRSAASTEIWMYSYACTMKLCYSTAALSLHETVVPPTDLACMWASTAHEYTAITCPLRLNSFPWRAWVPRVVPSVPIVPPDYPQ